MICVVCDKELAADDAHLVLPLSTVEAMALKRKSSLAPGKQWVFHIVRAEVE